ncbi:MAG TPA: hypothetical protein PLP21_18120 [Pyrinomonadaceae bacterium]|nr:hypothetical protein [Acidobacteriota bacterium]HQZ98241.1 hypothetical protein [Pyrinomonadaceae bacterium]
MKEYSLRKVRVRKVAEPSAPHHTEVYKNWVEVIGRLVVGMVALCYVTGMIVEHIHLSDSGVSGLSLLRLNFVMAGFWTLMPLLISTVLIHSILVSLPITLFGPKFQFQPRFAFRNLPRLFVIILGTYLIGSFLRFLLRDARITTDIHWLYFPIAGFILAVAIQLSSNRLKRVKLLGLTESIFSSWSTAGISLLAFSLFITYCFLVARNIYPAIPASAAGGKLLNVKFVIHGTDTLFKSIEDPVGFYQGRNPIILEDKIDDSREHDEVTNEFLLLLETDTEYVVSTGVATIKIPREIVKAVLVFPEELPDENDDYE